MSGHRHTPPGTHEHEFEASHGLPEALPAGEHVLWQGSPQWHAVARHVFHVRKLAVYFALILAVRGGLALNNGDALAPMLKSMGILLTLVALALGLLLTMAWLSARTTVYTVTNRRVVMRIGIVLSLTLNLPFKRIVAANLRRAHPGDTGPADIALTLGKSDKIAFMHLWPHARPWRLAQPEPMLRCLPDAPRVATLLATAWAASTGQTDMVNAAPQPSPAANASGPGRQGAWSAHPDHPIAAN